MKNIYGFGPWSPITFILAADKPAATAKPSFVSATDNSITINLYPSLNHGGAVVTNYDLEMGQGTTFTKLASYITTSFSMQHTVTFATDGIVTG